MFLTDCIRGLQFNNVGYSYTSAPGGEGSRAQLLQGVSFTVPTPANQQLTN